MIEQWLRAHPGYLQNVRNLYRWLQPLRERPLRACAGYLRLFLDWQKFRRLGGQARLADFYPCLFDRTGTTPIDAHYFYQAAWAMRHILSVRPVQHVDIGSDVRYVGMLSQCVPTSFVDIRPLQVQLPGLDCRAGSVLALPYADASVASASCLHVIEHIGLGRYGDPLDPSGSSKATAELSRILAVDGRLYVSVPVGRGRVCYNAHRVFSPVDFVRCFPDLVLLEFSYVGDDARLHCNVSPEAAVNEEYACGLFVFARHNPVTGVAS